MAPPTRPQPRTIAVRLTNWVGDCVMNTPFLGRLRALFPAARIVVFGRKSTTALFEGHPHVDQAVTIDDRGLRGFCAAVAAVRAVRADMGFLLPNSLKSAALFAAAGIPIRVGYARDGRRLLLTHPVTLRPEDLAVHETRYYLRLLRRWEDTPAPPPPPLCLAATPAERAAMEQWLAAEGIAPGQFIVAVNPAAFYGTAKRWLPDRFAAAAAALARPRGGRVVVTGLPTERDVAAEVCAAGGEGFLNAAGRMSLRQLIAFLARANLFLTNDSGAMHIGAALGTPLVAVFGSTDWVTTAPLGDHCRIVRVPTPCAPCNLRHCPIDHRCMTAVSVDSVASAAEELLATR
jgi:heptosyltransferase-2